MNAKAVILLTASVNVKGMVFTNLQDVEIRALHYIEAIKFYFNETQLPIIIAENTNHDFTNALPAEILNSGRIELLSFDGNQFPKTFGKGYGELESIHHAVLHSKFINPNTKIIKVTGRYKVFNIKVFIKSVAKNDNILCRAMYFKGQLKAFSGIFIFDQHFIENYLMANHELMNDSKGIYFEHVLATTFLKYIADGNKFALLCAYPRLLGISGTENIQHRTNNYYFWLRRNIIYKVVKVNYLALDWVIKTFLQG
ncbi:hypothetical protein [Pedobacter mucosus]|uniref:hypothetical protein n=1 Tax=Pedobacter mucosus TaxID=2895286 RepID=UPI001EE450D9|nr:hypothetical protein [Pedobacter mucosus]UKT63279.1 hypothetical protein LOK61_16095 [Pedobacter mucosus]